MKTKYDPDRKPKQYYVLSESCAIPQYLMLALEDSATAIISESVKEATINPHRLVARLLAAFEMGYNEGRFSE